MATSANENIYSRITSQIIAQLERGVVPWAQPWTTVPPFNVVSARPYRGINVLSTWAHQMTLGYQCHAYITFRQAKELGGWVRRGERGAPITLYRPLDQEAHEDEPTESSRRFVARAFTVFNLEQVSGLDRLRAIASRTRTTFEPLAEAERVIERTGVTIREGDRAAYHPRLDVITLPPRSAFAKANDFYSTAFHELGHWSGARNRLNRDLSGTFGSPDYAREELTAELTASFLVAWTGIQHVSQAASYLDHWLHVLQNDRRYLFVAAKRATEASDYIYPDGSSDEADEFAG